ncbi:Fibronectin type III domain-containing protein [Micromonospora rhizosphaerae]|uniref:Fibronectin type III domain-containing protein n=1 Tax=Micromonospora rhizosphaerae TaxID=568872 RepID=A0A1C6SJA2_9ACTN|nr:FG-GAP-like repeat-containing protein [Micromonospora rhizosphaerae]SCL29551.1 Fibronectin type III domain-containing protein [Micromonospora rhizosphaerae]
MTRFKYSLGGRPGALVAAMITCVTLTMVCSPPASAAGFLVPPSSVSARASGPNTIVVSWNSTASTSYYRVLRATVSGGPYTVVGEVPTASFTDTGLTPATRYFYVVQSGYRKKLSAYSMEANAVTAFTAPASVHINATGSAMDVRWEAVPGAARYEVLRVAPYETWTAIGSTTAIMYRDENVVSGSYYGYAVRAVASNGVTGTSLNVSGHAGPATRMDFTVYPPKAEPGQWVLLSAEVRNADGSRPTGPVDFYLNGSWLQQVELGVDGRAEYVVQMGTQSLTFSAQYQGDVLPVTGASGSGLVASAAYPAYGSLTLQPAQTRAVGGQAMALASGDLTGDGLNDVVVTSHRTVEQSYQVGFDLFVQQADHTLAAPQYHALSPTGGGLTPTIADVDGDGRADLVMSGGDGVDVYRQTPQGLAAPTPVSFGTSVTAARVLDLDGDGVRDLVVDGAAGAMVRYGTGGGAFGGPVNLFPYYGEVVVADLAGDDRPDVAVLRDHVISVLTQLAPREFSTPVEYAVPPDPWEFIGSFAAGDVDGDGRADLVVSVGGNNPSGRVEILTRDAAGTLGTWRVYPSRDNPSGVLLADMNGDDLLDVFTTHTGFPGVGGMLQRPDGWLGRQIIYQPYSAADIGRYGFAAADITGDGRLDLLLADPWVGLVTRMQ